MRGGHRKCAHPDCADFALGDKCFACRQTSTFVGTWCPITSLCVVRSDCMHVPLQFRNVGAIARCSFHVDCMTMILQCAR